MYKTFPQFSINLQKPGVFQAVSPNHQASTDIFESTPSFSQIFCSLPGESKRTNKSVVKIDVQQNCDILDLSNHYWYAYYVVHYNVFEKELNSFKSLKSLTRGVT